MGGPRRHAASALLVTGIVLLVAGGIASALGADDWADRAWATATVVGVGAATWWLVASLRQGRVGVDIIAVLALLGALAIGEPLAGAVVTLMLATGRALEDRAEARARRDLALLVEMAPRTARRLHAGAAEVVPVEQVGRGEEVLVGPGEVVPVDGRLVDAAVLDEAMLTGEPLPVERPAGDQVRSGSVNAGGPLRLLATSVAAESTYATIVRLVEQAQAASAPFVRAADRVAAVFVPVTLLLAGGAWWASGDAVRAVAVLVVATPCPLILAAPIAVVSGIAQAARVGVVVKGGAALERLARGRILLFDKTGTLTRGRPELSEVVTAAPDIDVDEVLRLAASLEQLSPHVMAGAVVTAARARGLRLSLPDDVVERHGYGMEGRVEGRRVRVGKAAWVVSSADRPAWVARARRRADLEGASSVVVAVDGEPEAALLLQDPVRPDAPRMVRALRHSGLQRMVLVTGDRADVAETVGRIVGVDAVVAECDPAQKLAVVRDETARGSTVMVGDGVNDAPALASADVGVALAARGATASSEAADIVLTTDRVDGLADAILVARRSRRAAVQAVVLGMGLSAAAMVAAAAGLLPPTAGAVLQEGIDVLAILVALRAALPGARHTLAIAPADAALARRLHDEHIAVRPVVERVRAVADGLDDVSHDLRPVQDLLRALDTDLLPHEHAEEDELYPVMARLLGGPDSVAALSRTHAEIDHQVSRLRHLVEEVGGGPLEPEDRVELRRLLYGLYGVLRLHDAQEEEGLYSVLPAPAPSGGPPGLPVGKGPMAGVAEGPSAHYRRRPHP